MKAKLIGLDNYGRKPRMVLDRLPVVIGRNPEADVRLDDRWVSRVHTEISEINGTLVVRDLDSRNGTLVNGQYIKEAHLLPGDRLTVGLTSFEVQYKRSPNRSSAPTSLLALPR
jgi:pSer/pThr/pTyr-binding forkhead associated (FHA) protein